jgi:hypothetical protein
MREKAEGIRKIKIYSFSLMLTADIKSQEVEKYHQIGNCRFSSVEAMLLWIKFSIMQNSVLQLLVTANVPSSPILVNRIMEAIHSSDTLVHTRATRHNIPEDCILHDHA